MNITVSERKFTLRSEYDISAPGFSYYAEKKLFSFRDRLQLMTGDDHRVVVRMRGRFFLFRPRYDFQFSDGRTYYFWCEKVWKRVFVCEGDGEEFRLYEHKGLNYSIFQDNRQIAAFTKNRIVIGKGNRYDVRVDRNANVLVVICMVLTTNTAENDNDTATVTFDYGNIGPEERPFDESWEPED